MTTSGVCIDRWYVLNDNIQFVFKANCVDAFRWAIRLQKAILIDSHWRQLSGHESFLILYLKGKYRIDIKENLRGGGAGGEGRGQLLTSI